MRRRLAIWHADQTYLCIEEVSDRFSSRLLVVSNNGVVWSAQLFPDMNGVKQFMASKFVPLQDKEFKLQLTRGGRALDAEYRLPLDWARRTVKAPGQTYTTEAKALASAQTLDGVVYTGFEAIKRRSAHSLEALHKIMLQAIADTQTAWPGWTPDNLDIRFHDTSHAFGLAFAPGEGDRKISLHVELLSKYDAKSIWRVIVHEMCHHWREERWPRQRTGIVTNEAHDERFCEQLGMIDEQVRSDQKACRLFIDTADPSIVASIEAKKARTVVEPTWTPDAGKLLFDRLKSGEMKIDWVPNPGFKWHRWSRKISDVSILELMGHFAPADWRKVRVESTLSPIQMQGLFRSELRAMDEFILAILTRWPRVLVKSLQYVKDLQEGPLPP